MGGRDDCFKKSKSFEERTRIEPSSDSTKCSSVLSSPVSPHLEHGVDSFDGDEVVLEELEDESEGRMLVEKRGSGGVVVPSSRQRRSTRTTTILGSVLGGLRARLHAIQAWWE